jgi:hypothetical protein
VVGHGPRRRGNVTTVFGGPDVAPVAQTAPAPVKGCRGCSALRCRGGLDAVYPSREIVSVCARTVGNRPRRTERPDRSWSCSAFRPRTESKNVRRRTGSPASRGPEEVPVTCDTALQRSLLAKGRRPGCPWGP